MRRLYLAAPALGLALLAGCGGGGSAPRISAGGATFVDPVMQKWSAEYRKAKGAEIDYVAKGSGYGISNVTSRTLDFGCSDAPMSKKELEAAKDPVVHVPVALGAVAVAYNLPEVAEPLVLSGPVLAKIFLREITRWDDPAVKALNPAVALPAKDIVPVFRAESSGTTNLFTEYLAAQPGFEGKVQVSKSPKWPAGGLGKEGNDGVAGHVKDNPGTIGYVELAYAKKNNIPVAKLVNKAGKPVLPEPAAVAAAVAAAAGQKQTKEPYSLHPLAFSFVDAGGDAAYPIVGASYAVLYAKQPKDKGPVIVEFLRWVVTDGQSFAPDLHYAPLPPDLAKKAQNLLGTVTFE